MNKAEIIGSISEKSGLSKAEAGRALDAFVETVTEELANGERIALVGFGSWTAEQRDARTGRNPRTGESIQIAAKRVVKFKAGASLSQAVN